MTSLDSTERPVNPEDSGQALTLDDVSCQYGRRRFLSRGPDHLPQVVDHVSLALKTGETLALVGESGSGKSTLARTVAGLHPPQSGRMSFAGKEIEPSVGRRSLNIRQRIQIVFQNPDASLNHRHRIGTILERPLKLFFKMTRAQRREKVQALLQAVRLPGDYITRFPSEISGGERQRVAIARALAAEPSLLLCDEVVSALDVSVQAAILDLLQEIQDRTHLSVLFITHDLAVVRWFADRVAVLYRGHLCEVASVERLFHAPAHPYTRVLLDAVPRLGGRADHVAAPSVETSQAQTRPSGCAFASLCPQAIDGLCGTVAPPWHVLDGGHRFRCHLPSPEPVPLPRHRN